MAAHSSKWQRITPAASIFSILVGGFVLVGWFLDIPSLKSVLPGLVTMKANAALAFVLAGISLQAAMRRPCAKQRIVVLGSSAAVHLIGLLTLVEYLAAVDLQIDQLLAAERPDAVGTYSPGRMAPSTALNFLLLGGALFLLHRESRRAHRVIEALVLTAALIGLLAIIGYLYEVPSLYGVASYTQMALHTSVTFLVLSIGVLFARPDHGLAALFTEPSTGALIARIMVPIVVVLPPLINWLQFHGQRAGLYGPELGLSIVSVASVVLLGAIVIGMASFVSKAEARRKLAEAEVARARAFAESIVATVREPLVVLNSELRVLAINRSFTEFFRVSAAEANNQRLTELANRLGESPQLRELLTSILPQHTEVVDFEIEHDIPGAGRRIMLLNARKMHRPGNHTDSILLAIEDITERKRAERELRQSAEALEKRTRQLEAANKELEGFSYSVAHDLRSPLRAIHGFSSFLMDDYASKLDAEGRHHLEVIQKNTQKMGQLIDDLLAFAGLGRREVHAGTVDMTALAGAVAQELRTLEPTRNIELRIDPLPAIRGDAAMLRQVWFNLLGNAVKYTRSREVALIEVSAEAHDHEVVYRVQDNGVGFDMRYAGKLFGVFQRLHSSADYEGTGVGLALVQRIVERHNGRVRAEGKPDQGATFWFTLPRDPCKADPFNP